MHTRARAPHSEYKKAGEGQQEEGGVGGQPVEINPHEAQGESKEYSDPHHCETSSQISANAAATHSLVNVKGHSLVLNLLERVPHPETPLRRPHLAQAIC